MPRASYHRLLQRQLRKASLDPERLDPAVEKLIALVNEAYEDFDADRKLLEHAIDISSREMGEANQKLQLLADDAQRAARFKADFLANMSHEIRTPLNGILGICEILREQAIDQASLELVELLSRSSKGLISVINDVLDISKIEAGKLTITARPTNLRSLLQDLTVLYSAAAQEKKLELATCIMDSVPQEVSIDDGRVRQIVTNLIGNAVKFTPDYGGIMILAEQKNLSNGMPAIRLAVADSGIGIPPHYLKSIFEAFTQVDSSVSRRFGGTGLGLSITHRLVELMGGTIEVHSYEGVGSLFQVILPFEHVRPTKDQESSGINATPKQLQTERSAIRILLAEDNLINQKVALHALQKSGFSVALAANGKQALDLCSNSHFDLILMDCQMPLMSGFEATALIRQLPNYAAVPIIALTALAIEGDKERCLRSGMSDYLAKPFKREDLEGIIVRWLKARS